MVTPILVAMSVTMEVHGFCDEKFAQVRDLFEKNFEELGDIGASFAATVDGEFVVDLWGGHADLAKTRPWEEDTIVNVYSTTKTMSFICALLLAGCGKEEEAEEVNHAPTAAAGINQTHSSNIISAKSPGNYDCYDGILNFSGSLVCSIKVAELE